MFDNLLFTEIMAQSQRDEMETRIRRASERALLDGPAIRFSARGALARLLVRMAMVIDANAGRRAATRNSGAAAAQ